ncbi:repressor LexA [candidate division WOR-1 bacterium RIFOXYA12_FULL_43_27]|uniref:LexA repressor n=1 Tax=candidate division WOR-1 bacterium RIFOXYC2_FULL_46_14 TaxID=1802587 RepID=A0A1F4U833_UNCSA|nr:MAG: repressor LexA [candidate division WOR-1 bacterium RIFOXYA12_FULL_43_27]OGC19605.1 MAG: repressor LexA [candidate division WOR-1 bacterium RIFOXYB2_FULL_46_45]OGC30145.1 MAG: repressor LexA [candidate division WOR-1 bacterium RIFOXYA2_FULL_46_56]OGC41072.1 MAG: repressor LexA [candidate division WOR-1 bacterium RIFOXYC2_FULL_46_14]
MEPLTSKQRVLFHWINGYIKENDYSPTLEEIQRRFNFRSIGTVQDYVKTLEKKGYLYRNPNMARSMQTIETSTTQVVILPLLGFIAAGAPIEVIEQKEEMEVPASLVGRKPCYILQVKGDSMIEDHILNGDFIVVEKSQTGDNGAVCVCILNQNEATLKRVFREKSRVRLQPANAQMKPIYVKDVAIQGVVRGLFRRFD